MREPGKAENLKKVKEKKKELEECLRGKKKEICRSQPKRKGR